MSDVIEPTAVIGPDGIPRTGWERPEPEPYQYESILDTIYGPLGYYHGYGPRVQQPFHVPLTGI